MPKGGVCWKPRARRGAVCKKDRSASGRDGVAAGSMRSAAPPEQPVSARATPSCRARSMLGVVTAMETFCGQAYGARKYQMVGGQLGTLPHAAALQCGLRARRPRCGPPAKLQERTGHTTVRAAQLAACTPHEGRRCEQAAKPARRLRPPARPAAPQVGVVLQRALAISLTYCAGVLLLWTRGVHLLARMGQDPQIAAAAGKFTLALAPALVLDAADQCCRWGFAGRATG